MERKKTILLHAFFWLIVFVRHEMIGLNPGGLSFRFALAHFFSSNLFISLGYLSTFMFAFYGASFITAVTIARKKVLPAVLYLFCLLLALVLYRALLEFGIFKPLLHFDNYNHNPDFSWKYFVPNVVFYYWDFIMYGAAWALFTHWQSVEKNKRLQEIESKGMQLTFLQSQLNPHFLFNTINDIYALALKKSDQTPQALVQLSGLLRYALYDNKAVTVPLEKELGYIHDYLDLQRTGYENIFYVDVQTEGATASWEIPPMLLLPFVENAGKHGVTNDAADPVKIQLCAGTKTLSFTVANRIRIAEKDAEGGIGIGNIRKRLLLLYPGRHSLHITESDNIFTVEMEITR